MTVAIACMGQNWTNDAIGVLIGLDTGVKRHAQRITRDHWRGNAFHLVGCHHLGQLRDRHACIGLDQP